jgi:DNA adenine methylase
MNAILKYPGGKWSIARWIVSFFQDHKVYLEPYAGSAAVFFGKNPVNYETLNDVDGRIYNLFKVLREKPGELAALLEMTPFSRREFDEIQEPVSGEQIRLTGNDVEDARRFVIRCNQGFGSKLACRVGWKNTKSAAGPINPQVWNRLPDTVVNATRRLKAAQIENRPAEELIPKYNNPDCLIYADPPYMPDVRRGRIYSYEMFDLAAHESMLRLLLAHTGPVVLSGYDNEMYNDVLTGWHKETCNTRANSGAQRTEMLWMNYDVQVSVWNMGGQQ